MDNRDLRMRQGLHTTYDSPGIAETSFGADGKQPQVEFPVFEIPYDDAFFSESDRGTVTHILEE